MHLLRRPTTLLAPLLAALLLAACGADAPPAPGGDTGAAAAAPAPEPARGPELPDVTVQDLAGGSMNVADLAGRDTPVLVWFWAPHCPYCNEEAKSVEAFAKENAGAVEVVGLGTQDSVEEAQAFVREHGLRTPRMLYDPSFASWQELGIRSQPGAMLFDRDGVSRAQWSGAFDEQQVLDLASKL